MSSPLALAALSSLARSDSRSLVSGPYKAQAAAHPAQLVSAEQTLAYCQENFLNTSTFFRNEIPKGFLQLSQDIRKDFEIASPAGETLPHPIIAQWVDRLMTAEKDLLTLRKHLHFDDSKLPMVHRSLGSLYTALAYIRQFYSVSTESGKTTVYKNAVGEKELQNCLQALENLNDIPQGRANPSAPKYGPEGLAKSLKQPDGTPLSAELETLTFGQALLASPQGAGILIFCLSTFNFSELTGAQIAADPSTQGLIDAGVSLGLIMLGFGTMAFANKHLGYRVHLQQHLLADLQGVQQAPGNPAPANGQQVATPTLGMLEARSLFLLLLKSENKDTLVDKVKTLFASHTPQEAQALAQTLVNDVHKLGGQWGHTARWGTLLDHLFLSINDSQKSEFVDWLQSEEPGTSAIRGALKEGLNTTEGLDNKGSIILSTGQLSTKTGIVNTITKLIKGTNWADRKVGSRGFCQLAWGIRLNTQLSGEDKKFLLEEVFLSELAGGSRGAFAGAKIKNGHFVKYAGVASFYAATMVITALLLFTCGGGVSPLTLALVGLFGGAMGASTFSVLGDVLPHFGKPASFQTKEELAKELAQSILTKPKTDDQTDENKQQNTTIKKLYGDFKDQLASLKKEGLHAPKKGEELAIFKTVQKLAEHGLEEFACEFSHGQKNPPVYEIIAAIQKLPKTEHSDPVALLDNFLDAVYGNSTRALYKSKFFKELDFATITPDEYAVFLTEGAASAAGSKAKMFVSLKCAAMLVAMAKAKNSIANQKACALIFINAIENAGKTKASELFDLNLRNVNTYGARRVGARVAGNMFRGTLILIATLLVATGGVLSGMWWAGIAVATVSILLAGADYSTRKLSVLLRWSTRLTVGDQLITKGYRNYELVHDIARRHKDTLARVHTPTGTDNEAQAALNSFYDTDLDRVLLKNMDCGGTAADLKKHIGLILRQGYDQEAAARAVLRVLNLLAQLKEHPQITTEIQQEILEDLQASVKNGSLSKMLTQKGALASTQYALADFVLGAVCGIPALLFACLTGISGSTEWISSLSGSERAAFEGSVNFTFDGAVFSSRIALEINHSERGRTAPYEAAHCAISAFQASLAPPAPELIARAA